MPAGSVIKFLPYLQEFSQSIADFGAGTFRNTKHLLNKGFQVIAIEQPGIADKFAKADYNLGLSQFISIVSPDTLPNFGHVFDAIICNFVLNLLDFETNEQIAWVFYERLKPEGLLLVEVKERRAPSMKKALALTEVDRLFLSRGFMRLDYLRGRCSIAVLYKKSF